MHCRTAAATARPTWRPASGTGFKLITDHVPEFTRRGMCARDPKRALVRTAINMRVPRRPPGADEFKPYSPAATLPYAPPLAAVPHAQ